MSRIASLALAVVLTVWVASAQATATKKKTTTPAKRPVATSHTTVRSTGAKTSGTAKPVSRTTASRGRTAAPPKATWRTRQGAPSTDRYKEIQDALVAKGFLQSEDATGNWNASSSEALKRFQSQQNLDPNGRINSLSLIALGLGPKRDTASVKPPPPAPPAGQDIPGSGR